MAEQCGLCLSCGAPFLPDGEELESFVQRGNQSILYLNARFKGDLGMRGLFTSPKYTNKMDLSHVFHGGHRRALLHMWDHHTGTAPVATAGGAVVPAMNGAMPFHPNSSDRGDPSVATWNTPILTRRLAFDALKQGLAGLDGGRRPIDRTFGFDAEQTYAICKDCNVIMTQEAKFNQILGIRAVDRAGLVPRGCIQVHKAITNGAGIENAYGAWVVGAPGRAVPKPDQHDPMAPCVAYYLHLCLPAPSEGAAMRRLYLELCWLALQIACVTLTLSDGKRLSHGWAHHKGVLDFYTSYFCYRLLCFQYHGRRLPPFVQWHQKYFGDAIHCRALFPDGKTLLGARAGEGATGHGAELLERVAANVMGLYTGPLVPLARFLVGEDGVPTGVDNFFVRPARLAQLIRSGVGIGNFDEALAAYGINALLSRSIRLCEGYPAPVVDLLKSLRAAWREREIRAIQLRSKSLSLHTCRLVYLVCMSLARPTSLPSRAPAAKCSVWCAVLPLRKLGAFRGP